MLLSLSRAALQAHHSDCSAQEDVSTSLRVVVGMTCALSMLGSLLIMLSYCMIPGIRTKGREILINLSLMDFVAAASNCTGIAVNFNRYLGNSSDDSPHTVMNRLCVAQAFLAQYSTISSILWTVCLAVYIYLCVMVTDKKIAFRSVVVLYLLSYGLPAIVSSWYVATGKLGYDLRSGSDWCSIILSYHGERQLFSLVFGNDIWIYLTIILVPIIFVALHYHLRSEVHKNKSILTQNWLLTMQNVEIKLLFIPVIFILLRIWSLILTVVVIEAEHPLPCFAFKFFLYCSGFGDSGQGLFNGIIFVLFCHKVRFHLSQRCRQCLCCRGSLKGVMSHHGDHHTFYGSYSSDNRRSEDREASDESSDAASMTNAPHKSLLLNT